MKTTRRSVTLLSTMMAIAWCLLATPAAQAQEVVEPEVFYEQLAPYGEWLELDTYGRVWRPYDVEPGWRPYTHGHWVFTDDYGWMWESDYEWGWGPFHYGRWAQDPIEGWVWIPGREWAPAWVVWRTGGGFIGWAPMPPTVEFRGGMGFMTHPSNFEIGIAWNCWSFVPEARIMSPRIREEIVPRARNVTIVHNTINVTNYTIINNRIVNRSIEVNNIERVTGRRIVHYRVSESDRPIPPAERVRDDRLTVFRPRPTPPGAVPPPRREVPRPAPLARLPDATSPGQVAGRSTIGPNLGDRQTREREALLAAHRDEQASLQREHERERATQANAAAAREAELLNRRQAQERQALQDHHAREVRGLDCRHRAQRGEGRCD